MIGSIKEMNLLFLIMRLVLIYLFIYRFGLIAPPPSPRHRSFVCLDRAVAVLFLFFLISFIRGYEKSGRDPTGARHKQSSRGVIVETENRKESICRFREKNRRWLTPREKRQEDEED